MNDQRFSRPEKGYDLEPASGQLVLHVLCGGVGLYEVVVVLNEDERREFERRGEAFLDTLAKDVQRDPRQYSDRSKSQPDTP